MQMAKKIGTIRDIDVFEHDYDTYKNRYKCTTLEEYGVAYKLYRWLRYMDLIDEYETVDDVYENLSGARDGNRYDIHDDYRIKDYDEDDSQIYISYLYVINDTVWATLYNRACGEWYGDVEITNV